jgi:hypothetical protein
MKIRQGVRRAGGKKQGRYERTSKASRTSCPLDGRASVREDRIKEDSNTSRRSRRRRELDEEARVPRTDRKRGPCQLTVESERERRTGVERRGRAR